MISTARLLAAASAGFAFVASASLHAQAVTPALLEAREVPRADTTVALRVGGRELMAELRVPAGPGPHPIAIIIHGGCWVTKFADARYMRPMAEAVRQAGIATFNISYRRADEVGGAWPGTFLDVAAAAAMVRELVPRYHLDLTRLVTTGHSAGAHLALWLAAQSKLPATSAVRAASVPLPIKAVVALDGPGDLAGANVAITSICGGPVLEQLLSSKPDENVERWRDASPSSWLPLGVPQTMLRGGLDARVAPLGSPTGTMTNYARRATAAGDLVTVATADTTSHFAMLDPQNPAFVVVLQALRSAVAPRR